MKIKTVKRYYCDFCKKSGGSSFHMKNHESHCTLNPNRKCRMCLHINGSNGLPVSELVNILGDGCNYNFDTLHDHVDGCPACILSAIRQSKIITIPPFGSDYEYIKYKQVIQFDFKKESKSFWEDLSIERYY